jgi:hypothetical protein
MTNVEDKSNDYFSNEIFILVQYKKLKEVCSIFRINYLAWAHES